jgi:hypothetical protein
MTVLALLTTWTSNVVAQSVSSFEDIQFWTGVGANRAAIAIDWDAFNATDPALVWGFRWDGAATGEDMLRAVLAADDRLFAKLSEPGPIGISVWGVGYDANDNGQFALSDGTQFDADGVAVTGLPDEDAAPVDPADWYREGWFTGIWSYGTADQNPWPGGNWTQSRIGPSNRALVDGSWDSWAFAAPIQLNSFARNPMAAEAAGADGSADFDGDGDVDGADFLEWQRGDGVVAVDALDLELWRSDFGAAAIDGARREGEAPAEPRKRAPISGSAGASPSRPHIVPEPAGAVHAALVTLIFSKYYFKRRKFSCV